MVDGLKDKPPRWLVGCFTLIFNSNICISSLLIHSVEQSCLGVHLYWLNPFGDHLISCHDCQCVHSFIAHKTSLTWYKDTMYVCVKPASSVHAMLSGSFSMKPVNVSQIPTMLVFLVSVIFPLLFFVSCLVCTSLLSEVQQLCGPFFLYIQETQASGDLVPILTEILHW